MRNRTRPENRFVGREPELELLRRVLATAREGRGGMALIGGEPGVGKTSLARAFAQHADAAGALVLWGRGYEGGWLPPYTPWRETLSGIARVTERFHLETIFPDIAFDLSAGADGDGLSPEPAPGLDRDEARFRLHDEIARVLRDAASRQPLVIVLDDLHWADGGSLELLRHIVHFGLDAPILLVGTHRDAETHLGDHLVHLLTRLERNERTTPIRLSGLQPREISDLLEVNGATGVSDEESTRIWNATRGNSLFVTELIDHWRDNGAHRFQIDDIPAGLLRVVQFRLARLSPSARVVLNHCAVFSTGFDFAVLPHLTGLSEADLLDAIDELLAVRMIDAKPDAGVERYDFTHTLVRDALLEPLSPSRRVRLERKAAEAMANAYEGELHDAEIAIQYGRSASLAGAGAGLRYALTSVESARRGFDSAQAVFFLRIARDLAASSASEIRAKILGDLAIAEAEAVLIEDSRRTGKEAIEELEKSGATAATVSAFYADLVTSLKQNASAGNNVWRPLLAAGLAVASAQQDQTWARLMLLLEPVDPVSRETIRAGRWLGFEPRAVEIARSSRDERTAARAVESFDFRTRRQTDDYLALVRTWRDPAAVMYGVTVVANDLQYRHGAFRDADSMWQELIEYASKRGAINWQEQAINQRTILHIAAGHFDEARKCEERANALLDQLGEGRRSEVLAMELATAFAFEIGGDWATLADAWRLVIQDPSLGPHDPATLTGPLYAAFAAYCYAEAGNRAAARAMLDALTPILESLTPRDSNQNGAVAIAATAVWRLEFIDLAARYLNLAEKLEEHGLGDYPQTSIALTIARMTVMLNGAGDLTCFNLARQTLRESGQRPLLAKTELDQAQILRDSAHPSGFGAALVLARSADETFGNLGMPEWSSRSQLLLASMEGPPAVRGGLPSGLSEREGEVLRLVARGLADRQIGAQLFVSPRTVNAHVRNLLNKTGAVNRTELSAWAFERGLVRRDSDEPNG